MKTGRRFHFNQTPSSVSRSAAIWVHREPVAEMEAENQGISCDVPIPSKSALLWENWSRGRELNSRPADYESAALPLSYLGFVGCSGLCRAPRCFCCFDCTQIRHCHFSFLRFYHEVMRLHCRRDALRCVHTKRGMVQVSAWGSACGNAHPLQRQKREKPQSAAMLGK